MLLGSLGKFTDFRSKKKTAPSVPWINSYNINSARIKPNSIIPINNFTLRIFTTSKTKPFQLIPKKACYHEAAAATEELIEQSNSHPAPPRSSESKKFHCLINQIHALQERARFDLGKIAANGQNNYRATFLRGTIAPYRRGVARIECPVHDKLRVAANRLSSDSHRSHPRHSFKPGIVFRR